LGRLGRLYVIASCLVCGLGLAGAAALSLVALFSPESLEGLWDGASARLAALGRSASSAGAAQAEAGLPAAESGIPAGWDMPRPTREEPPHDAVRVDVGALESRLRLLESTASPWVDGSPSAARGLEPGLALRQLEAWETLREPLLELTNTSAGTGSDAVPAQSTGIETLAPWLARRVREITAERRSARERRLSGLTPATLARLLAEEGAVSDERALVLLESLDDEEQSDVLARVARTDPGRVGRLVGALLESKVPRAAVQPVSTSTAPPAAPRRHEGFREKSDG